MTRFAAALIFAGTVLLTVSPADAACSSFFGISITYFGTNCSNGSSTPCTFTQPIVFFPQLYSHNFDSSCDTLTWDFGDGTPTVAKTDSGSVSHTYAISGTYTVKLTASNSVNTTANSVTLTAAAGFFIFWNPGGSANEGSGSETVTLARSTTTGSASVHYATSDGTALAGVRYTATSGTLTFNDGEMTKSFSVPLIDDNKYEGTQYFNVTLSNPSTDYTIGQPSSNYFIADNDPQPTLAFQTPITGNEADGAATVTVLRTGDTSGTVGASWSDSYYGTSSAVLPASGTITFNPGETSKTFSVPLVKDGVFTGPRSVTLALVNPTGGANPEYLRHADRQRRRAAADDLHLRHLCVRRRQRNEERLAQPHPLRYAAVVAVRLVDGPGRNGGGRTRLLSVERFRLFQLRRNVENDLHLRHRQHHSGARQNRSHRADGRVPPLLFDPVLPSEPCRHAHHSQ
jgi:hypothetical protein